MARADRRPVEAVRLDREKCGQRLRPRGSDPPGLCEGIMRRAVARLGKEHRGRVTCRADDDRSDHPRWPPDDRARLFSAAELAGHHVEHIALVGEPLTLVCARAVERRPPLLVELGDE
jgi:hypothetical protein